MGAKMVPLYLEGYCFRALFLLSVHFKLVLVLTIALFILKLPSSVIKLAWWQHCGSRKYGLLTVAWILYFSISSILYLLYIWEKWNIEFELSHRVFMTLGHPFEHKKHPKKLPSTKLKENTTFVNRYLSKVSVKSIGKISSLFPWVTGHFSFSLVVLHPAWQDVSMCGAISYLQQGKATRQGPEGLHCVFKLLAGPFCTYRRKNVTKDQVTLA